MVNLGFIKFGFCVVSSLIFCASLTQAQPSPDAVPGVLIVKYKEGHAKTGLPSHLQVVSVRPAFPILEHNHLRKRMPSSVTALKRIHRVYYNAPIDPAEAARSAATVSSVEYAEPLYPRVPYGERTRVPNDPLFEKSSYLRRMKLPEAWDIVKGEDSDVTIAIIDQGTNWRHEDLFANVWTNPGEIPDNQIDDDRNGYVDDVHGWDFPESSNDPSPNQGNIIEYHGTFVTGISNAVADNNVGMAGSSWNAKFIPINTNCKFGGLLCYTSEGILYAAMVGADIINGSYGASTYSRSEEEVIQAATDLGSLVIIAAGNQGYGQVSRRQYPGGLQTTLTVCGLAPYSDLNIYNYGYSIDVCAPGIGVLTATADGNYEDDARGTSFAAPIVSGIAALVKTKFPDMTPFQIREQIRATADNIDGANDPSFSGRLGRGRVNAYRAVTETDAVSVRLTDWTLTDTNGDGRYDPQERVTVEATFVSYLSDVDRLTILWGVNEDEVILEAGQVSNVGPIKSGESFNTTLSFTPTVNVPYKSFVFIEPIVLTTRGDIVSGGDAVPLIVNDAQVVQVHDGSNTIFSVTSEGNLGWVDYSFLSRTDYLGELGSGIIFSDKNIQIRYEAGLVVGRQGKVASSVFETRAGFAQNQDFEPATRLYSWECGQRPSCSNVELVSERVDVTVVQETLVDPLLEDIILIRYFLDNPTNQAISGIHAGIYATFRHSSNISALQVIDEEAQIVLTPDANNSQHIGVGAINDRGTDNLHISTLSDERLRDSNDAWPMMIGGINESELATPAQYIGFGPLDIQAKTQDSLTFAIIYGEDYENALTNMRLAKALSASWIGDEFGDLAVSPKGIPSLSEGDSVDIVIELPNQPVSDVTVTLTANMDYLKFSGNSLSDSNTLEFTTENWNQPQTVMVGALNNEEQTGHKWRDVFVYSPGYSGELVEIFVQDNDAVELNIEPIEILNLVEGMTADFTVKLTANPRTSVIAFLSQNDFNHGIKLTLSTQRLIFSSTNWDQSQTVTVTAEENDTKDGDAWQYVYVALFGEESAIAVRVLDNDEDRNVASESVNALPTDFALGGNYPNPFQTSTEIVFDLPVSARVSVSVFDMLGRKVQAFPAKDYHAGWGHTIKIDIHDLASGIYLYQVTATGGQSPQSLSALMTLLR